MKVFYQQIQASTDAQKEKKIVSEWQANWIFARFYAAEIELKIVKAELQLNDDEWIKSALDVVAKKIKELVAFESELNDEQRSQLHNYLGKSSYMILYNLCKNQADSAQVQNDVKAFTEAIDKIMSELVSNETVAANPNTNATQVLQQID